MNNSPEKMEQERFTGLEEQIIALFDTSLVSSPHVFTPDKNGCNRVEDTSEPLSSPKNAGENIENYRDV